MAVASFQDLCAGICELVQVTPPALAADHQGLIAFHLVWRGVTVSFVHCPDTSWDHLFVIFELGPLSAEASPRAHAQGLALLDANFALLQVHPPVFSRDPATGQALLQHVVPLFDATPSGIYALLDSKVESILQWRADAPAREADASRGPCAPALAMFHQIA